MQDDTLKIRIPDDQLANVIRKAYELSQPQGLGFLHFQPGGLPDEAVAKIIGDHPSKTGLAASIHMDYVSGRAVKLRLHKDEDGYFMDDNGRWYDHSEAQWEELKTSVIGQNAKDAP